MGKYRGKYKKCRDCLYAGKVWSVMVEVNNNCPHAILFSSGFMVDKYTCELCKYYIKKLQQ